MFRLHALPSSAWLDEIQDFVGLDCGPIVWVDYPASYRCYCGPVTIEMGSEKAVYDFWFFRRGFLSDCSWVDC